MAPVHCGAIKSGIPNSKSAIKCSLNHFLNELGTYAIYYLIFSFFLLLPSR